MSEPVFISDQTAKDVLTWPDMIAAIRTVYAMPHDGFLSPPRSLARFNGAWMRSLTAILPTGTLMGTKFFGFSRQKRLNYLIALFEQENADVVALLDGNAITSLRTAATTAVAVERMAPAGPVRLGVLGSGAEARTHVRAIAAVRPIEDVRVFSPSSANRSAFAAAVSADLHVPARAVETPREAVDGSTIVIGATRTTDKKPVIAGEWLTPGMLLLSIGATLPEQREIDVAAIAQAGIIVADMPHEVMNETGCFRDAAAAGVDYGPKFATLNDLVQGKLDERLSAARYRMFRSVGSGIQDIAVAELAFRKASEAGATSPLPMTFASKHD